MRTKSIIGMTLIASGLVAMAGVALATAPSGFSGQVLSSGSLDHNANIKQADGESIVTGTFTWEPGGSTGWHSHPGKTLVTVISGELTIYRDATAPDCEGTTYSPGDAFLESPRSVHLARNEGSEPLVVTATYFRVPPGTSPRIDQPDPGICPF